MAASVYCRACRVEHHGGHRAVGLCREILFFDVHAAVGDLPDHLREAGADPPGRPPLDLLIADPHPNGRNTC